MGWYGKLAIILSLTVFGLFIGCNNSSPVGHSNNPISANPKPVSTAPLSNFENTPESTPEIPKIIGKWSGVDGQSNGADSTYYYIDINIKSPSTYNMIRAKKAVQCSNPVYDSVIESGKWVIEGDSVVLTPDSNTIKMYTALDTLVPIGQIDEFNLKDSTRKMLLGPKRIANNPSGDKWTITLRNWRSYYDWAETEPLTLEFKMNRKIDLSVKVPLK